MSKILKEESIQIKKIKKVKIFKNDYEEDLEDAINDFIEDYESEDIISIDIKPIVMTKSYDYGSQYNRFGSDTQVLGLVTYLEKKK